jgi:2',3'-cyclic-nucleotide 2'-phosphodiesterase (5'-nucleotidase family)
MAMGRPLFVLAAFFASVAALAACESCKSPSTPDAANASAAAGVPDARLYLVSDMAGALEPCGCVKDQLGGTDHFGALLTAEKKNAPSFVTLSSGPLFFMDMELADDRKSQEIAKAETIAGSFKIMKLAAFSESRNLFAGGASEIPKLKDASGAAMLGANVSGVAGTTKGQLVTVGNVKIGVIGVGAPDKAEHTTKPLEGVTSSAAIPAVKEAAAELTKEGAQALVVLAAVGRGEAKRIADEVPDLLAILVGSTGARGDENTKPAPPERIGDVLVVETANHLQTVGVLDLHLRDAPKTGLVKFADGTGVARMQKREELNAQIDDLRGKIAQWENDKSVAAKDIADRKADVAKKEAERDALDKSPPPASGSFFRYTMREIRDQLGADEAVKSKMNAFYKKVNEENKIAFKDKKPIPAEKGQPAYVGVDMCTNCHEEPKKVWDATKHATAYPTLEKQFKEANLDCVSCHVTGYDKPGGSTVTHTQDLKNVQCEVCHGPGSLHVAKPESVKIPIARPGPEACVECHHPPHVHVFDAKAKMAEILGPGHGRPMPQK